MYVVQLFPPLKDQVCNTCSLADEVMHSDASVTIKASTYASFLPYFFNSYNIQLLIGELTPPLLDHYHRPK
jgi:hypothetical protein